MSSQIPKWASGDALKHALARQKFAVTEPKILDIFGVPRPIVLAEVRRQHKSLTKIIDDLRADFRRIPYTHALHKAYINGELVIAAVQSR